MVINTSFEIADSQDFFLKAGDEACCDGVKESKKRGYLFCQTHVMVLLLEVALQL